MIAWSGVRRPVVGTGRARPAAAVAAVVVDGRRRADAAGRRRVVAVVVDRGRRADALVVGVSLPWSSTVTGVFPPWSSNDVGVSLPWSSTVVGVLDVVTRGCVVVGVPPSKREMSSGSGVVLTDDAAAIAPTPASPMAAAATAVVIKDFFMAGAPLAMRGVELTSSPSPRAGRGRVVDLGDYDQRRYDQGPLVAATRIGVG